MEENQEIDDTPNEEMVDSHEETHVEGEEEREGEQRQELEVVNDVSDPKGENPPPLEENAPPAFTPNFKYKVLKEEKEIPERFRSLMTDETSEKEIREIFEKADGIEAVKMHRDQLNQENEFYKKEWTPFILNANQILESRDKGDLKTVFEKLGLSDDVIFGYTRQQLELRKDPARYSAYEQSRADAQRTQEIMAQNQRLQDDYRNIESRMMETELNLSLTRPEIRQGVESFEALNGPGSFRSQVILLAQGQAALGKQLTPEQATAAVLQLSGWNPQAQKTPTPAPAVKTPAPRTVPAAKKPTLPNIAGGSSSPAKTIPKDLADLRRMGKEMEAAGH